MPVISALRRQKLEPYKFEAKPELYSKALYAPPSVQNSEVGYFRGFEGLKLVSKLKPQ